MQMKRNESLRAKYPVDIDRLRKLLCEDGMPRFEASQELGIPQHALDAHCAHHQIRSGRQKTVVRLTNQERRVLADRIRSLVDSGMRCNDVAKELGLSPKRVSGLCSDFGIRLARTGPKSGQDHPDWKGGRILDADGYVQIYCPGHPSARRRGENRIPVYVAEHRLVMEQHLGRQLLPTEVVHHKDGDKQNNSLENLELFESNAQHLKHELTGRCPKWTEEGRQRILDAVRRKRTQEVAIHSPS